MTRTRRWPRCAVYWLLALGLHELMLGALHGSTEVASLFAPGSHTALLHLSIAAAYLLLRLVVMLLWPLALASGLYWWIERARRRALA